LGGQQAELGGPGVGVGGDR